jgi:PAS domain S-box-containing protein
MSQSAPREDECNRSQRPKARLSLPFFLTPWGRSCSVGSFLASIGVFLAILANSTSGRYNKMLLPALSVALTFAVLLAARSFWRLRAEQQGSDWAFRNIDCESSSIFENVLDGILIVNDDGDCLDANPAAASLLRLSVNRLIGQSIGRFLVDRASFKEYWNSFLHNKRQRGRARLIAGDGTTLFVDFAGTANYLPGRHVLILCDVTKRTRTEMFLQRSEERFQHMANNIQEIFWTMDANTHEIAYVSPAYTAITGRNVESLEGNPSSCLELVHPDDRTRLLSRLRHLERRGVLDEEFRFVRPNGEVRWAWLKGVPVPAGSDPHWLVGTVQDISLRKQAEMLVAEHLDAAERARAEAEALRKSTLALSQNLSMDSILDMLLQCISELVPYDVATVLFVEDASNLMIAREAPHHQRRRIGLTFAASGNVFLQKILFEQRSLLLPDVAREPEWREIQPLDQIQSWLGVPLMSASNVIGILSLGAHTPNVFAPEHLRLAKSLAVAAAVAIKNARIHERAEIYAAELEINLRELRETHKARERVGHKSPGSTDI